MHFIVINFIGLLFVFGVVYWFWIFKPKAVVHVDKGIIDIVVEDGVYTPNIIRVQYKTPSQLRFLRKDPSPCAEQVIFNELGISLELPINQAKSLTLENNKKGEFSFTCEMGMYRGTLIVI